jgi:fermentation-respiration switch protein FrsA (DUF1100 family)
VSSFIVHEVWAVVHGNVKCVLTLPFRQETFAHVVAKSLRGGYVLRTRADRQPEGCLQFCYSDGSRSWVIPSTATEPVQPEQPEQPAPVAPIDLPTLAFRVWDDVNNRYVTTDGAASSPILTFPSEQDASVYAKRLNDFGGYGGWMSLRFHVRG